MKIIFGKALILMLSLGIFFLSFNASAQGEDGANGSGRDDRTWEQIFIDTNIEVSEWFDSVAEGLDLFLAGSRVTNRPNESNVRIENTTISTEGRGIVNSIGISVNPRLPNLEEYWHLKFTTYDERADRRRVQNEYLRQTPRRENYGATVGVFKKLGNVRTSFQPRIELQDPLKVSHSIIFESVATLKTYDVNPKLEFYASPDRGVGIFQALNFHFILTKVWSLTMVNQGDYEEKSHLYTVLNGFSLGQTLTPKSALAYNIFFTSLNQPNYHLGSFNVAVSYSHVLYKRVLDYQVTPNVDFARTNNFNGIAGLTFTIRLHF